MDISGKNIRDWFIENLSFDYFAIIDTKIIFLAFINFLHWLILLANYFIYLL